MRHPAKLEDITRLLGQGKVHEAVALFEEVASWRPSPRLEPGDLVNFRDGGPWYEVLTWNGGDVYYTRTTDKGSPRGVKRSLLGTRAINRQGFVWTRRQA